MRAVLALALVLFVLALAYELGPGIGPQADDGARGADPALEIVASGHGTMLPAARFAGHLDVVDDFIRIGDRLLVGDGLPGVRTAALARGEDLLSERRFDVREEGEARALRETLEAARPGEVLVLASSGDLRPVGDAAASEMERALETLGAVARLGGTTPESWAMIALRGADGWTPLAESYSVDSGVAITFVLAPDFEPAGFRGDYARVRASGRREIELTRELAGADATATARAAPEARLHGRPMPGLALSADADPAGGALGLRWDGVPIADGAGFVAWLGLAAQEDASAVRFELWVDGEEVGAQGVFPGAPWKVFLVDLRSFAGRKVRLELRARTASGPPAELLLGRPMLVQGYDRSPLEVWADR